MRKSPNGYYYKFDPTAPAGERLTRKRGLGDRWTSGHPDFSLQTISAEELRFIAGVIDDARVVK